MSDSTRDRERLFLDQKEVYRQILDAIADMVLVKGRESHILWANKAFRDYYGMTNDQLRDLVDATFNEVDFTEQYVRDDLHVYTTGEVLDIPEEPVTRSDGLVQIFHTVKSPIRDDAGRVLMTVGVSRNITESKRVKEDLARYREHLERLVAERTAELSRLSTNLSTILSSLVEGIVALDADGRAQLLNPAAETWLGCTSEQALGRALGDLFDFTPEQGEPVTRLDPRSLREAPRPISGWLRAEGREPRLVALQAAPLKGNDETAAGTVVLLRDLALEREVTDQRLRHQKLESLGLLAGGIAHDFNNILAGILGSLSVARRENASGKSAEHLLEQAERACLRAQGLTAQLLTFARGGAPVKKAMDVVRPVREAADLALLGSPSQLDLRAAANVWAVDGDEGQLVQAVGNLVMNAKQAMPSGGKVTIEIDNVRVEGAEQPPLSPGDYVRVVVRDQGGGIPPEHLQRIFDPYFTTRATGSGLGLSSVHSIISQHGGHTAVSSVLGVGSQFSLYLPAALQDPTPVPEARAPRSSRARRRVLVLDDDEGVRGVMSSVLALLGHDALIVGRSSHLFDALEQAEREQKRFDAIIVDLTMPGDLPGREVIARVLERDPSARLIVMSGYSTDPVMANYLEYGLSARLQKPFTVAQVSELFL